MFGNGRPLTRRQLVRLMIGLTLLAWATQTLFAQWGFGAESAVSFGDASTNRGLRVEAPERPQFPPAESARFVAPRAEAVALGGTLELRGEATVVGGEVRLKQIARWSSRDQAFFQQTGELILARLDEKRPYLAIDIEFVRRTLAEAGVNVGMVKFVGPMRCIVNRSDAKPDPEAALAKWLAASEQTPAAAATSSTPVAAPAAAASGSAAAAPVQPAIDQSVQVRPAVRSLREVLTQELATRLNVPVEGLQVDFRPSDERLLNLCDPQFRFTIDAPRSRRLGETTWQVAIVASAGTQRVQVGATARLWQTHVVVNRPISVGAPINAADVVERRTLVDQLTDEPILSLDQAVGQQAARDLKPGVVLTSRMVAAVPMARTGQLITVTLGQGGVRVKTVVRAMEGGSRGQRIRVKNETTNEMFDVILTGPQQAEMGA